MLFPAVYCTCTLRTGKNHAAATVLWDDHIKVMLVLGALINAIISKLLKRLFRHSRPAAALSHGMEDHGMPSSHAQSLFYFFVYLSLRIVLASSYPPPVQYALVGSMALFATVSSARRVRIGLHTWLQVLVGALLGSAFALWWQNQYTALYMLSLLYPVPQLWAYTISLLVLLSVAVVIERGLQKQLWAGVQRVKSKLT